MPAKPWVGWRRARPRNQNVARKGGWSVCCEADSAQECLVLVQACCYGTNDERCVLARGTHPDGGKVDSPTPPPPPPETFEQRCQRILAGFRPGEWIRAPALVIRLGLRPGGSWVIRVALDSLHKRGKVRKRKVAGHPNQPCSPVEYALAEGGGT